MYRDPTPKPPKREGEGSSLEELSAKGAQERDRLAWERRQEEQRTTEEQRDALADEVKQKENAYLAGKAPVARFVYIAGIVVLVFAGTATLGALWPALFEARNRATDRLTFLTFVAVLLPFGLVMFRGAQLRRRRILERARVWLASFPFPVVGFFEVLGKEWGPTSTVHTHPFGKLIVTLHVQPGGPGESRLADALAAVAKGTLSADADDRLQITSPPFVSGSEADAWLKHVLDELVRALHAERTVARVHLYAQAS